MDPVEELKSIGVSRHSLANLIDGLAEVSHQGGAHLIVGREFSENILEIESREPGKFVLLDDRDDPARVIIHGIVGDLNQVAEYAAVRADDESRARRINLS